MKNVNKNKTRQTEKTGKYINIIADQLYAINARNISLPWIGMRKIPTSAEISELNEILGFIIHELRVLADTGTLDIEKEHKKYFNH